MFSFQSKPISAHHPFSFLFPPSIFALVLILFNLSNNCMKRGLRYFLIGGLVVSALLLVASMIMSCKTNLLFEDLEGFSVEHNKPAPSVEVGRTTEVKFWLRENMSLTDNIYTIKLYISSGRGIGYLGKSFNQMTPNEIYLLELESDGSFVFNYTPQEKGSHHLELTIQGTSYTKREEVHLRFNVV